MLKIKITFDSIGIHNINYDVQKYQIVLTKTFIIPLSNKQEKKTEPIFFSLPEIEEESYSSNNLGFHFSLEMSQLAGGWRQTELETEKFETERDGGPWSQMTWLLQTSDCLMLHHQACHCSALFCIFQPLQWWWWPGWYLVRQ